MRIAIPVENDRLCPHFGHCSGFALIDVDEANGTIMKNHYLPAPEHVPGLLPRWLHDQGAQLVIAGGMGMNAQQLLEASGVRVLTGARVDTPLNLVQAYLKGQLVIGDNTCDH